MPRYLTSFLCSINITIQIVCFSLPAFGAGRLIVDQTGLQVRVPETVRHVICSGAGALRLLTYLQAQNRITGVDDMEKKQSRFDARPYALSNPQFRNYPVFGEFRGHDNPERILALKPPPQVIFKTFSNMGHDPAELARKTRIPVVVLKYGDLGKYRADFYQALRIMAQVMAKEKRAEAVIDFFNSQIGQLNARTCRIASENKPACFVGGIAHRGPHGFASTEPGYPPFAFINVSNPAYDPSRDARPLRHSTVAKEMIVAWDPDLLFLDLSTLQMGDAAGGLFELKTKPAYQALSAVRHGRVYGVLPYNWYTQNFGSILANAWFIGKLVYPEAFADIEPAQKADEIYTFLFGRRVFAQMNAIFSNLVFAPIPLE